MKKLTFPLIVLLAATAVHAQTNTFPSSGDVGIGTTTPAAPLHAVGGAAMAAGWNRTAVLQATYPVLVFNSNAAKYAGIGYDFGYAMRFWVGGTSTDVPGSGLHVMSLYNNGNVGIGSYGGADERLTIGAPSEAPNVKVASWAFLGQEASHLTTVLGGNAKASGANTVVAQSTADGYRAVRMKFNEGITFHAYQGSVVAGEIVANERMRITPQGNVGIGTTNPSQLLTLARNTSGMPATSFLPALKIGSDTGTPAYGAIGGYDSLTFGIKGVYDAYMATLGNDMHILSGKGVSTENHSIYFYTSFAGGNGQAENNQRMIIRYDGNVGIGTSAPTHKLAVNGTIRAKEVVVDTGWADYVFADDYRLAPLSEVEAHIREKKHLPGIPSAAEVTEHGVSMGEMQAKLLAKVEELTLHIIALEKRTRILETENTALRANQPGYSVP